MCSAASFASSTSSPSGRVPLIGIVQTRSPRRARKSSGEAETIVQPCAGERPRVERPQRRERGREARRVALERRRQVLHEVDLVHVAALDRPAGLADGGRVVLGRPGRLPFPDPEGSP